MSDIIRRAYGLVPSSVPLADKTTKELARLVHEAEDTDNDVLLVDVYAELERRSALFPNIMSIFMEWYWKQWHEAQNAKERSSE